ncbi:MAG TPA: glycine cleavage system protein GcvH [Candidatus Paceibacterota bacterium]|nr:glycine cleavage system protein GcvH [Verrucomicrobiota bacterium]HRY49907.1 glycine cleavage system protein GcvH [Candidatus Paceibacterota bacterium]HSA02964.1 glycine cleavage system protein GcvH [Candidatus Paceibacterota bacterium]
MTSNIPKDLRYARSHEWVRVDGNQVIVGISDHAQKELTDIVFVELPTVGRKVKAGEACAVVESVKTASDVYAPMSGEVVAVNSSLGSSPGLVNTEPYGSGWFFQLRLSDPQELEKLLTPEAYGAFIQG